MAGIPYSHIPFCGRIVGNTSSQLPILWWTHHVRVKKYRIYSAIRRGFHLSRMTTNNLISSKCKFAIIQVLPFQNNLKDLDPSYKMDLDLWDCFGIVLEGKKSVLYPRKYGIPVSSRLWRFFIFFLSSVFVFAKVLLSCLELGEVRHMYYFLRHNLRCFVLSAALWQYEKVETPHSVFKNICKSAGLGIKTFG